MKIETNADYIKARKQRFDSAIKEELQALEKINNLKQELYHTESKARLAEQIKNSCLDDIAFLEEFESNGKEFEILFKLEDKHIEITKGWRFKK